MNDYGVELNFHRPGYDFPTIGIPGYREFIEDLIEWRSYVAPGESEDESREAAHRIAAAMSEQGSPTSGSMKYSSTGQRTGWMEETIDRSLDDIARAFEDSKVIDFFLESGVLRAVGAANMS